jgi:Ser/Thr protein kinase RdoA (MazF antagonist)
MSGEEAWKESLNLFDRIAEKSLAYFPCKTALTMKLLNYSENATYLIKDSGSGEKYILRVSRPGYHTKEEIEGELAWLKAIHENTPIEVLLPLPNKKGEYIQVIRLENAPEKYLCTMFTFLNGDLLDEENESALIGHFETLGEVTAHLHEHSIHWEKSREIKRPFWDFDTTLGERPIWGRWQDGRAITAERAAIFQKVADTIQKRLDQFGKGPSRFGIIHADLRLTNFIVEGEKIKVIDFDDCGFGWYLYDLASSLSFIEHKTYVPELIQAWLKGYRKVRELSPEEEAEIPTFIMLRRLMLIAWIGSRNNETTKKLGEEYTIQTVRLAKEYLERFSQ